MVAWFLHLSKLGSTSLGHTHTYPLGFGIFTFWWPMCPVDWAVYPRCHLRWPWLEIMSPHSKMVYSNPKRIESQCITISVGLFFYLCGGRSGHSSDKHAQTNMDPSIVAVEKAIQEMILANVEERTVHESKERWLSLCQCLCVFQVTLLFSTSGWSWWNDSRKMRQSSESMRNLHTVHCNGHQNCRVQLPTYRELQVLYLWPPNHDILTDSLKKTGPDNPTCYQLL